MKYKDNYDFKILFFLLFKSSKIYDIIAIYLKKRIYYI